MLKTIKTLIDLRDLEYNKTMPHDLLQYLTQYFRQLHDGLSADQPLDEFTLEDYGYIVLLEQGDNPRNLSCVGLTGKDGLLSAWPEHVELVDLESLSLYKIAILYDNEYMMTFFARCGSLEQEIETWLADYIEPR